MEVEYRLTPDDYTAYSLYAYRRSKVNQQGLLMGWVFIPLLCFACATIFAGVAFLAAVTESPGARELGIAALGCLFPGAVYALVHPILYHLTQRANTKAFYKELWSLSSSWRIRLILTETSLVEITERTRSEANWRDMAGIEEVGDHTFIFVTELQTAILPRHGFLCEEDYFRARDFALARVGKNDGEHTGIQDLGSQAFKKV
jgi:hypothetical protein